MGSSAGALKTAVSRTGLSIEAYLSYVAAGLKRCSKCKHWKPLSAFNADNSRGDGRASRCRVCVSTGKPRGWHGRPNVNPQTGRPGPAPDEPRDGDKIQARHRVNVEVRTGRRPHTNSLPCVDCGHIWKPGERRHEYDHHLGYASEHHLHIEPVCTTCHATRDFIEARRSRDDGMALERPD